MQDETIPQSEGDQQLSHLDPQIKRDGWKSVVSTIIMLVAAPLIALLLITFVFQSYEVEGPSMEHTLQNQDRLIVVKLGKTWARVTGSNFIPKRGEIIIFVKKGTFDLAEGGDRQLIKRVIGLPGDRIVVGSGHVTVFNNEYPEGFDPDEKGGWKSSLGSATNDNDVDITVNEGEVFVMGDNRGNSQDSRAFGPVPAEDIVGTLGLRIFPLNKIKGY